MEYQFDREVPPCFRVGKFLYEPKHPSGNGPDQDSEHDKPDSIWDRTNQGVFRVRVYVHSEAISKGRTAMSTEPPSTRIPFRNGPTGASVHHFVMAILC